MSMRGYVAIVDDDASVCRAIARLVTTIDLSAETFPSAESFLASRLAHEWRCLILDVRLPGMDGFELQKRLGVVEVRVPILFVTAHADEHARQQARLAGAVDLLSKPFDEDELLADLETVLEREGGANDAH